MRFFPVSMATCRRSIFIIALSALLPACGHVPLTTIAKLSQFDMLKTNPETIRLAVKHPDSIRIPDDGATMTLKVTRKKDGAVLMEEMAAFQEVVIKAAKAELAQELQDGWQIEIYRIPEDKVPFFRSFQKLMASLSMSERKKVEGSLSIKVSGCLTTEDKPGEIRVSTFLKAAELGGYVTLLRNIDLEEQMAENGRETGLVKCPDKT